MAAYFLLLLFSALALSGPVLGVSYFRQTRAAYLASDAKSFESWINDERSTGEKANFLSDSAPAPAPAPLEYALLSGLVVGPSTVTILPPFSPSNFYYVINNVTSDGVTLTPIFEDSEEHAEISGKTLLNNTSTEAFKLDEVNPLSYIIALTVSAPGHKNATYYITLIPEIEAGGWFLWTLIIIVLIIVIAAIVAGYFFRDHVAQIQEQSWYPAALKLPAGYLRLPAQPEA
eukprot:TRINITY_DN209_c0_g1_i2.p1 TRINITY_DN209_c0_g1~~TRINITY_DN209_c0_g1_i2.p1  ORF type:complete len:231 (+),score=29.19 TRINITY_DN209_c0_g1_i2:45-737(+)